MRRREFLRRAVPAGTLPFLMGGFSVNAYGRSPFLEALLRGTAATDRVLVVIQMNGGNDGLNTVIPLDQYAALTAARANILIPSTRVLKLSDATGLHPSMTGLRQLYLEGKLAVIQGVSYPSPNFSHFRATDIWLTASSSNVVLSSGWMGRWLDQEFPGFPDGYPNAVMPDPLAISIGSVVSPGLQGPSVSMGLAVSNPNSSYILPGGEDTPPNTPAGHELTFIRQIAQQTQLYGSAIKGAASRGANKSTLYPAAGSNTLADQMKIVAQLIAGGLKTRVYMVNIGGFDTHASQVVSGATDTGTHATLLGRLAAAVLAFQDDLRLLGHEQRVLGMTFSEFGRRIKSNASSGTDHGSGAPMFVFGANVNAGLIGTNPVLPASPTSSDNVAMQFDFRRVYTTLLKDWFGTSAQTLQAAIPGTFQTLPIVKPSAVAAVGEGEALPRDYALYQNYPNPFNPTTTIRYALPSGGRVRLEVYAANGSRVAVLVDADLGAGEHEAVFNAAGLASGPYFCRMSSGGFAATRKLLLIR